MSPTRCMAVTQKGNRCKLDGEPRAGTWVGCGHHPEMTTAPPEADGDGEHVARVNELLVQAMNHGQWRQVPATIRKLIEHAWVDLDRATEEP